MWNLGRRFSRAGIGLFLAALVFSGCAKLPEDPNPSISHRIPQTVPSTLSSLSAPASETPDSYSGFEIIDRNDEAFQVRLAMADLADRTLDLQYYIWNRDQTGALLMERVLRAADRGVRVRLLLDDLTTWGGDEGMMIINNHPNIEIKIYNPLGRRYSSSMMRPLAFVGNFSRVNHRMHNKIMAADNQVAIVGGRNIGDEYFGVSAQMNYLDMDLFTVGPVVDEVSHAFDEYWNSEWSFRFELFNEKRPTEEQDLAFRKELNELTRLESFAAFPYEINFEHDFLVGRLEHAKRDLDWAPAQVIVDVPRKDLEQDEVNLQEQLREIVGSLDEELLGTAPYFVATKEMIARVAKATGNGVQVRMLTNSVASNDVSPAQWGYADKRKKLLEAGMQLYELRPDAADIEGHMAEGFGDSKLGLHAKMGVYDRKIVFVGSFNIDPRSIELNTEIGIVVYSEKLAAKLAVLLERNMAPMNAYQVVPAKISKREDGSIKVERLKWIGTNEDGGLMHYTKEPNLRCSDKLGQGFYKIVPIDSQL